MLQEGLAKGHWVSLKNLLATTESQFYADPHGMHYAEARYLCYYVQSQDKLREFYKEFVSNSDDDPTGVKTLCHVLEKESIEAVEKDLLNFVRSLKYQR